MDRIEVNVFGTNRHTANAIPINSEPLFNGAAGGGQPPVGPEYSHVQLEQGGYILLESGGKLRLERMFNR